MRWPVSLRGQRLTEGKIIRPEGKFKHLAFVCTSHSDGPCVAINYPATSLMYVTHDCYGGGGGESTHPL